MAVTHCAITKKRATIGNRDSQYMTWYNITTDDKTDDLPQVYLDAQTASPDPLPAEGQQHPTDLTTFVRTIDFDHRHDNDFNQWIATVRYGPPPVQDSETENPLDWEIQYRLVWKLVSKTITNDIYGNELVNTARDPIVNPPRDDFKHPILVATKNFSTLDEIIAIQEQFQRTTNDAEWFGVRPGVAKFEGIEAGEIETFNDVDYYPARISVLFDYDASEDGLTFIDNVGWNAWDDFRDWENRGTEKTTDEGLEYLAVDGSGWSAPGTNTATPRKRPIVGADGQPITAPVYLTKDGFDPVSDVTPLSQANAPIYELAFALHRPEDYTNIGIGGP